MLNVLWAGVAGGAFYAGIKWNEKDAANAGANVPRTVSTPGSPASAAAGKSKTVDATLVSKSDDVLDFLRRYGIGSGQPLSADTMRQAITEALRESNPVKSQMLFARLMEELTPENAASAYAMIRENVGGMESMRYMGLMAYAWGSVDPEAAMKQMAEAGGDRRGGMFGQASVLSGWASTDPKGALEWYQSYDGEGKEWMSNSLVSGLAKTDPEAALKFATGLEDQDQRNRAADTLVREIIKGKGIDEASKWIAGLSDASMQKSAFQTVADQLYRSDPAKAIEMVKSHANDPYAAGAISNIAGQLARQDVQKGLEFANQFTGAAQSSAYRDIIGQWMRQEDGAHSLEASQYVTNLPAGPARDAGAAAIANSIDREDPVSAIAWAKSIQDAEMREDAMVAAARAYSFRDPAGFQQWLPTSGLSAEAQAQITERRGGGPDGGGRGAGRFNGGGGPGAFGGFGGQGGGGRGRGR